MKGLYYGVKYRKLLKNETEDDINYKLGWEADYVRKLVRKGRTCYADCTHKEQMTLLSYHLYSYPSPHELFLYLFECAEQRDLEMLRDEIMLSLVRSSYSDSIQYLTTKSTNSNSRLLESLKTQMRRVFERIIDKRFIGEMTRIELAKDYEERMKEAEKNEDN